MRRLSVLLLLLAGCAASSAAFVAEREGYIVSTGFVIRVTNMQSPRTTQLKDGTAYEVTMPGCSVVLEFGRGRREKFELSPGDFFVHGQPYSYVLRQG